MRRLLIFCALISMLAPGTTSTAQSDAASAKQAIATKLDALLRDHINAKEFEENAFESIKRVILKSNPNQTPEYKEKMLLIRKYIKTELEFYFEEVKKNRINFYIENYDRVEIERLIDFFESPLGKKHRKIDLEASRTSAKKAEPHIIEFSKKLDMQIKKEFSK